MLLLLGPQQRYDAFLYVANHKATLGLQLVDDALGDGVCLFPIVAPLRALQQVNDDLFRYAH
jgi:hypothetical protein